ncbi:tubulin-specific chaperone Rbl2 [Sodiomyces alkalinus F11]|uniref:Tubulin-specific chaperone A n=1 Tax=Sodiomyces alkalinus (strain CBS 110278 / VKM F-3762 / F11) TaxID=1314773 RepID=A0A3N2PQS3_SODAK|nr:tubulin-specific chaperone Rbl2 [Sodiomyces alkalinus F11]ROT36863.1 tubulin-specific chaperone Rbl2 [Sodiomyces alkalinus F11]
MPPPSQLSIATLAVTRLLREEISYEKELINDKSKVVALENEIKEGKPDEDGNRDHMLKQLKQAVAETEKIFPHVRTRINEATAKLEEQIALAETNGATEEELDLARSALKKGLEAKAPGVA